MLFTSARVSLDTLEKPNFRAYVHDVIRVLGDPYFYIDLFNKKVRNAEACRLIASKLLKNLQMAW